MTSTQELVGIHNHSAHKELVKIYNDELKSEKIIKYMQHKIDNQLITYYLPVCYLHSIQQYPVNTTYNSKVTVS